MQGLRFPTRATHQAAVVFWLNQTRNAAPLDGLRAPGIRVLGRMISRSTHPTSTPDESSIGAAPIKRRR
jgi:hypothetical protein